MPRYVIYRLLDIKLKQSEMTSENYPNWNQIQIGLGFGLYLIHNKAQHWQKGNSLAKLFLNAFPSIALEDGPYCESTPKELERDLIECFCLRFFVVLGCLFVLFGGFGVFVCGLWWFLSVFCVFWRGAAPVKSPRKAKRKN